MVLTIIGAVVMRVAPNVIAVVGETPCFPRFGIVARHRPGLNVQMAESLAVQPVFGLSRSRIIRDPDVQHTVSLTPQRVPDHVPGLSTPAPVT